VEAYINLLQQYTKKEMDVPPVQLQAPVAEKKDRVIININSEADSRRLPKEKAISIIAAVRQKINNEIILVGSNKETVFVDEVFNVLSDKKNISNLAGKTNLQELISLFGSSAAVLTTDSGPAHVANALGIPTVVLFGAGNEHNTAPYNKSNRTIIRLGQLTCEPCVNNQCKLYGVPQCLVRLDENMIASAVSSVLT
jgi:ADP-heptose:LPS heptosyltransferase